MPLKEPLRQGGAYIARIKFDIITRKLTTCEDGRRFETESNRVQ